MVHPVQYIRKKLFKFKDELPENCSPEKCRESTMSTLIENFNHDRSETDDGVKRVLNLEQSEPDYSGYPISPDSPDYKTLEGRRKSYKGWTSTFTDTEALAKAGFFYTGRRDIVQCPYCSIEGFDWQPEDDPLLDHKRWAPNCAFIMTEHDNSDTNTTNGRVGTDTCGKYGIRILPNSVPEDEEGPNLNKFKLVKQNKGPCHQDKFTYASRLATFEDWPKSLKQKPEVLAEAGFFYIGVGDQAVCFHCGGGLKQWEEQDDPWEEHALWFPKCYYLYTAKGSTFIDSVQKNSKKVIKDVSTKQQNVISETKEQTVVTPKIAEDMKSDEVNESEPKENNTTPPCKICYKNDVEVVFLPCGHIVSCVKCSVPLRNCAVCRCPLEATVRAFLS